MHLDDVEQIEKIALKAGFTIFDLPNSYNLANILTKYPHLAPVSKNGAKPNISIDAAKEFTALARGRQSSDLILVVEQPEKMSDAATNALLKSLEEPNDKVHYVFLSHNSSQLLQTIISRSQRFYIDKNENPIESLTDKEKAQAKEYISATRNNIAEVVEAYIKANSKDKKQAGLQLVENSIALCYQSYLMTGNKNFVILLEKLEKAHDGLMANGNIRLQLIANML